MSTPITLKVKSQATAKMFHVEASRNALLLEKGSGARPAVILVRRAAHVEDYSAALLGQEDIISVVDGDWSKTLLVVLGDDGSVHRDGGPTGDDAFFREIEGTAPELLPLGQRLIGMIRETAADGILKKTKGGKWINDPTNSFTLKVQPRKKDFAFTIYGSPNSHNAGDFLKTDQNGYSRGWVSSEADAQTFAKLVAEAHRRRTR